MTRLRIILLALLSGVALILAACETAPPPPPAEPAVVAMSEYDFQQALQRAKSTSPASAAESILTDVLANDTLTTDMRIRALYDRGELRRTNRLNLAGGKQDFDELLRLGPNHSLAANARLARQYLNDDLQSVASRRSSGQLQNISDWFDDEWVVGDQKKAATRYQKSGLSPKDYQVKQLTDAGYICRSGGSGDDVYKYGDRHSYLTGLKWCRPLAS